MTDSKRLSQASIASIVLAAMGAALIWYAILTYRIAAKDFEFIQAHNSSKLFPVALYYRGNHAYFGLLEPALAADDFRLAVACNPVYIPAWLALARVELAEGNRASANRLLDALEPMIHPVSTWKWQELLLAYELRDSERFKTHLNFILNRLPYRIPEAYYLAQKYYGDAASVVPYIAAENQMVYLNELMRTKETDAVLGLWQKMQRDSHSIDEDTQLRVCQFLLANKNLAAAKDIWLSRLGEAAAGVHDGGFEQEPLNRAFGWVFQRNPQVSIERTAVTAYEGNKSLHLHFRGTDNVSFQHVSQIVPVAPGREYSLRFARKNSNLTTDQGVFLEVAGYQCKGLYAKSSAATGTSPWVIEELRFKVPEECQALTLRVRRKESLMFDNKIAGDYWLDGVHLGLQPAS